MDIQAMISTNTHDAPEYFHRLLMAEAIKNRTHRFKYFSDLAMATSLNPDHARSLFLEGFAEVTSFGKGALLVLAEGEVVLRVNISVSGSGGASVSVAGFGPTKDALGSIMAWVHKALVPFRLTGTSVTFNIAFQHEGSMSTMTLQEVVDEVLYEESYPDIEGGVHSFIESFLASPETVLIVQGPPGTGKTRFLRALLSKMTPTARSSSLFELDVDEPVSGASVLYTGDETLLDNDELFASFMTRNYQALVIEDADHLLKPRSDGNKTMRQFLTLSDGIIRNTGKKLIFSTNLPSIRDIDEALLRPGRCFGWITTRALSSLETLAVLKAMGLSTSKAHDAVHTLALGHRRPEYALAEVYKVARPFLTMPLDARDSKVPIHPPSAEAPASIAT